MQPPSVSLVVVCHNMGRELPRTLLSLSPPYQQHLAEGRWEIIVVDNGSDMPPREADFAALDAEIRIISLAQSTPSPAPAVNEGLRQARGDLVGAWIDGARLATPGLVRACFEAARLAPRPVVATLNFQLGPRLQRFSVDEGYGVAAEDALLASIGWPSDGYRLFEIATPEQVGPAAAMLESNALFLPRDMWAELRGYDEGFASSGGGLVNPDVFSRACSLPGAQLIRVEGEGTFHQFHDGVTTGPLKRATDALKSGAREYLALRGRPPTRVRDPGLTYRARVP